MNEIVTFKSRGPRTIYVPRLGQRIRFDSNGMYSTKDPAEIRMLSTHRHVIKVSDDPAGAEQVVTHKERGSAGTPGQMPPTIPEVNDDPEPDAVLDHNDFTRPELNRIAMHEGIDPDDYTNKKALTEAINKGRAERPVVDDDDES